MDRTSEQQVSKSHQLPWNRLVLCTEFKIIAKTSGQSRDHLDQSKCTPRIHPGPSICIVPQAMSVSIKCAVQPELLFIYCHVAYIETFFVSIQK